MGSLLILRVKSSFRSSHSWDRKKLKKFLKLVNLKEINLILHMTVMDLNDKLHTQDSDILKHSPICLMFHFKWDNVLQNKHHGCTK